MAFEMHRFLTGENLIMACLITGVYDVNRNTTLEGDNYELVRHWAESLVAANLQGIIFHNSFTEVTCKKHQNDHVAFVRIDYDPKFNPNVFRYFVYRDFLQQHINLIRNIFVTDISDVTVVTNPFADPYFIENKESIFCGDEPKPLDNDWMRDHSAHLRSKIVDYADYESRFAQETLLNCGIIGGSASLLLDFFKRLCEIHQMANSENHTAYTGDMGAFNYLVRTQFNTQLRYGPPVNTVFKMYENERKDCWFRHK